MSAFKSAHIISFALISCLLIALCSCGTEETPSYQASAEPSLPSPETAETIPSPSPPLNTEPPAFTFDPGKPELFFSEQFSEEELTAYRTIAEAVAEGQESAGISVPKKAFYHLYFALYNCYPVTPILIKDIEYNESTGEVTIQYNYDTVEERTSITAEWASMVEDAIKSVLIKDDDTLTVIKKLYDYVVTHVSYAQDGEETGTYAALKYGKGICGDFAGLYSHLLTQMGIWSTTLNNTDMEHRWVIFRLNGEYYHADPTFESGMGNYDKDYPLYFGMSDIVRSYSLDGEYYLFMTFESEDGAAPPCPNDLMWQNTAPD